MRRHHFDLKRRLQLRAIALLCLLSLPFSFSAGWVEFREWWKLSNRKKPGRERWLVKLQKRPS